jgi:hypothetical protein
MPILALYEATSSARELLQQAAQGHHEGVATVDLQHRVEALIAHCIKFLGLLGTPAPRYSQEEYYVAYLNNLVITILER